MEGVPDDYREENPGGYVPANDDDDNDNGIADKDEAPVNDEDNLVAISLSILPANLTTGEVELRVLGSTPIQVWKYPDKRELIIPNGDPPKYYKRWPPSQLPPTLYVEGMSPGTGGLMLLYVVDQQVYIHNDLVCITVGCSSAGPHNSSVQWINPDDDYHSFTCAPFGEYNVWVATYDVDFKYTNCTWVCEISNVEAKTQILVRDPSSLPGKVSVSQASDVPCADANLAKYDLNDANTADDEGAPRTKYWCYNATVAHEEKHIDDWQSLYRTQLDISIACCELCHSDIDCDNPDTITCQAAENYWQGWITTYFALAALNAWINYDDPDTPFQESDQRAYSTSYGFEQPISAALPEGCTP
jgi:hypothetical protein